MTFDYINDDMYKHLVCIIIGGAENDGVLHGLAHVCEHMCLLLLSERITRNIEPKLLY